MNISRAELSLELNPINQYSNRYLVIALLAIILDDYITLSTSKSTKTACLPDLFIFTRGENHNLFRGGIGIKPLFRFSFPAFFLFTNLFSFQLIGRFFPIQLPLDSGKKCAACKETVNTLGAVFLNLYHDPGGGMSQLNAGRDLVYILPSGS